MTNKIAQALLGRPMRLAQAQSPSDRLQDRGYLDRAPPPTVPQGVFGPEQLRAFEAYMRPRINVLEHLGVPPTEALGLIREMPDVESEWRRLGQEGAADPRVQEEIRKLLEDAR